MIRAVGDAALIVDDGGMRLVDAKGVVAKWPGLHMHAVLADPPRLAVKLSNGFLELVDLATGQGERAVERRLAPLAFTLDGSRLFALDDPRDGAFVVVDDAAAVSVGEPYIRSGIVMSRRGAFAGVSADRRVFVARGRGRTEITEGRPIAFSANTGLVLVLVDAHARTVSELAVFRTDGRDAKETSPSIQVAAPIVAMWASAKLDDIAALDSRGFVHRSVRGERETWIHRGPLSRALAPRIGDVRVDTERGSSVVDGGRSIDACFTSAGVCAAIRDGRAIVFDDDGETTFIEGPTNLVAITPHPRGVLAVDGEDRAHVLAIDGDERDDEVSS